MKLLLITFGMVVFISIPYQAKAQEVMYCADIGSNGFHSNKTNGLYEYGRVKIEKYKIQVNKSSKSIEMAMEDGEKKHFTCKAKSAPGRLICQGPLTDAFNLNLKNGQFVYARTYGYVFGHGDSVWVSYGRCDAF